MVLLLASTLVLLRLRKIFDAKNAKDLDNRWVGPYKITANLGKGLFKLQDINSGKVCSDLVSFIIFLFNMYI